MADCSNCQDLKKQLDELKQKHFLDFKAIKQKIVSTNKLIGSYQEKCHEHDKQKKSVVEVTTKLEGAQRSVAVIKLQLKKSLELKGPLQKKCDELEQEKLLQNAEMQKLQDKLKGSESLVAQLQSVIKQNETLTTSLRLEASLRKHEVDEYKKSQKKNEGQISKLEEQILTKKNANMTLNKELSKSQYKMKTLLDEAEKSKMLIADLEKQLNSEKSEKMKSDEKDHLRIIEELKEELLKFKQRNIDENEGELELGTTPSRSPRRSPRIRKIVALNREEPFGITEERSLTRLQQKHFVEQIKKKTLDSDFGQKEKLISGIVEEAKVMSLMDRVNELFDVPDCPCLSPLPPSPSFNHSSNECTNNSDTGTDRNIDRSGHEPECKGNENIDESVNDEIIPQIEDQLIFEKRDLTTPESKLMTLRSRKRRRKGNTSHNFGIFSKQSELGLSENSTKRTLSRSQSEIIEKELHTPEVGVLVTRSRTLKEVVKQRRRKKRRLSSNESERSLESSDISVTENNDVDENKQLDNSGGETEDNYEPHETLSLGNFCERDMVNKGNGDNGNTPSAQVFTTENQTANEPSSQEILITEITEASHEMRNNGMVCEVDSLETLGLDLNISKREKIVEDGERKEQAFVSETHDNNTEHISGKVEDRIMREGIVNKSHQSFINMKEISEKNILHHTEDTEDECRKIKFPKQARRDNNHSFPQDPDSLNCVSVSTTETNLVHPVYFNATQRNEIHQDHTKSSVNNEEATTRSEDQNIDSFKELNEYNTVTNTINNYSLLQQEVLTDSTDVIDEDNTAILNNGNIDENEESKEQTRSIQQCTSDKFSLGRKETITSELRSENSNESSSPCQNMEGNETTLNNVAQSLNESLHSIPSLSPMPVTPKKPGQPAEINNCFDSLNCIFPLSPIPPSPPRINTIMEEDLTIDEIVTQKEDEKKKLVTNELPSDALHRYTAVDETEYIILIFRKLKNQKISLEQLITALSSRRNVNSFCQGLIRVLSDTENHVEHELLQRCAEQYEFHTEAMGEPIVSQFEMQVLVAVNRLCKIQRYSSLLNKFINCLKLNLCQLFKNDRNVAGLLAMCRIHTGVCRLMGDGRIVLVFCYDILKQRKRHSMTERILVAVALVWPYVLGKDVHSVSIHPETVTISGPTYRPFLATLQIILMSRESSYKRWFQWLCDWCDIPEDINVLEIGLARDLMRVLRGTSEATYEDNKDVTMDGLSFEAVKCLELLAFYMGWKWTTNVLFREVLWPFFKEWNDRNDISLDSIFASILRLLGYLGGEKLQKGDMMNLDAIVNLVCAILINPNCEKVSFSLQVAAANTLLEIFLADPLKITEVLEGWCAGKSKTNDKLVAKIAHRLKTRKRTKH
ncbi:uncharacterized protein LOC114517665 [Dendronephthya gigantea]|uniref:uncharacterized protein LOC114517665 n=1 Tax=Dendronephthya gigantea TaxID=151771 RepID=UPI00106C8835|nr:uncharacterized protein LOC114517665 [Dendronephthya gigantea]